MQRQTSEAHIFQIYQQEKWDHNKKVKLLLSNAKSTNNTQVNSNKLPKFPHEKTKEMILNKEKSFFNYEEANEVEKIVNNLKFNGINGNEIGVITPYFAQASIIRKKISNFNGIKVSSVDNFQGSERDFIILSLVRTNEESNFGFVSDEKRLNVALTRARKGLIIIGNYDSIESSLHEKNCFLRDLCHFYENKLAVVKYNDIKKLNNTVTSNQLITNQHT